MTERPHEGHAEGRNADLQQVLDMSMRELLTTYAPCSYAQMCDVLHMQKSHTLGDLCSRLKAIRPKLCEFKHDHFESGFAQIDCVMRETNAACGHLGLVTGDRYRDNPNSSSFAINENNAVATIEEAIALLHIFNISCKDEQQEMEDVARILRQADFSAVGIRSQEEERRAELRNQQAEQGERIMASLAGIMQKLTTLIRAVARRQFPVRQDYAVIKGKKFNTMWGEFQ